MDIYELDRDEAIILQSGNVTRDGYDESEFEDEELHELVLTNKHLIYIVSDIDGEDEDVIKVPLSAVKVIGGKVQVKEMNHELYGRCLQVQFKHGVEYWRFGRKGKQMIPQWTDALSNAILEVPMSSAPANSQRKSASSKKATTTSGISGFASAMKSVKDAATNAASSVRKQAEIDEDDDYTAEDNEPIVQPVHKGDFCASCGATLNAGSKFCHECGAAVGAEKPKTAKRETVYEGNLHKCPSCGEIIRSFESICPSCGHEFRGTNVSSVVKSFSCKIEAIDVMPAPVQKGRMKKGIAESWEKEKLNRKISLIRSFPIPNTKEDLFEFLILASSNIDTTHVEGWDSSDSDQALSDAWKAKYEQAYKKAKMSFGNSPELRELAKDQSIKARKHAQKKALITVGFIMFFAVFIALVVAGYAYMIKDQADVKAVVAAENARLELILDEINECIANEDYVTARALTSKLVFTVSDNLVSVNNARENWEKIRAEIYETLDKAQGIETDTLTTNSTAEEPSGFVDWFDGSTD